MGKVSKCQLHNISAQRRLPHKICENQPIKRRFHEWISFPGFFFLHSLHVAHVWRRCVIKNQREKKMQWMQRKHPIYLQQSDQTFHTEASPRMSLGQWDGYLLPHFLHLLSISSFFSFFWTVHPLLGNATALQPMATLKHKNTHIWELVRCMFYVVISILLWQGNRSGETQVITECQVQ